VSRTGTQDGNSPHLPRLLRASGDRRGEDVEGEADCECNARDRHAATAVCLLSTAASLLQPSILRNLIWPIATGLEEGRGRRRRIFGEDTR
jgi:hypothetical protein